MPIRVHIHTALYVYLHVFTTDLVTWIFFIILELFFFYYVYFVKRKVY